MYDAARNAWTLAQDDCESGYTRSVAIRVYQPPVAEALFWAPVSGLARKPGFRREDEVRRLRGAARLRRRGFGHGGDGVVAAA